MVRFYERKKKVSPTQARMFIRPKQPRKRDNGDAIARSYHLIIETRSLQREIPVRSADDNADIREQTQETYITQLFFAQFPSRWRRRLFLLSFYFIPFLTNFGKDKSLFNAHLQKEPRFAGKMHGKNSHLFRDFWEENAFIVCLLPLELLFKPKNMFYSWYPRKMKTCKECT